MRLFVLFRFVIRFYSFCDIVFSFFVILLHIYPSNANTFKKHSFFVLFLLLFSSFVTNNSLSQTTVRIINSIKGINTQNFGGGTQTQRHYTDGYSYNTHTTHIQHTYKRALSLAALTEIRPQLFWHIFLVPRLWLEQPLLHYPCCDRH